MIIDESTDLEQYKHVLVLLDENGNTIKSIKNYGLAKVCLLFDDSNKDLLTAINDFIRKHNSLCTPLLPSKSGIHEIKLDYETWCPDWVDITDTFKILCKSGFVNITKKYE